MADAYEDCTDEGGGTWTDNADAWDGDTGAGDDASTSTGDAQTYGSVDDTDPFSAIDAGDTIQGIEVLIWATGDGDDYVTVELYKPTDTGYITQTYDITPDGTPDWTNDIAGGAANTWGEYWSAANDIKDGDFGVRLTYHNVTKANTISVFAVRIRVTYASITPVTVTKNMAIRYLKEQTATKDSDTRYQKATTLTKNSLARYLKAATLTKLSAIRYLLGNLIDKDCDTRYFKEQSLSKSCACKYVEEGEVGAQLIIGSKKQTGSRTVHK